MPGFVAIISEDVDYESLRIEYKSLGNLITGRKQYDNALVERYTNPKFLEDKVFYEDQSVLVLIDGFVLNFKDLINKYAAPDYFNTVKKIYYENGDDFFKEFRGDFAGLLYDKTKSKWLVFTNPTSTKPVYYYKNNGFYIFSSEVKVISQILRTLNHQYSLDTTGAYFLLTYGFMLEDYTLIEQVKHLRPGSYIKIENNKISFHEYVRFENTQYTSDSKEKIIDNIDTLFREAVRLEYEKDLEYGYKHIATLSGGLDSRTNVMTAYELGYRDILCFTFAQSDYYDEMIAKKITSDLGYNFLFQSLDGGNFLKNVQGPVLCNDGLVVYSGSAHLLSSMEKINLEDYGLIHMGQLGDAILGTYLSKPKRVKPKAKSGAYSSFLMEAILPQINDVIERYNSEEMFKFYNRGCNGIFNGNWTIGQFTESSSPFLDVDFIKYCFSIPPFLKYKQRIYIEWILSRHPDAAKYIWERTRSKLTANRLLVEAKVFMKRVRFKLLGKSSASYSMNPFQYWYNTNEQLRQFANNYFQQNIYLLDEYPDLKRDCTKLFNEGRFVEKTQAMSLLEAIKLHFHQNYS